MRHLGRVEIQRDAYRLCPGANVISPSLAICKPVSIGFVAPEPNTTFKVALEFAVSLFASSACHSNVWVTALPEAPQGCNHAEG